MDKTIKNDAWVWIIVQNPGGNEQFLGLQDTEKNISFVPFFQTKEDGVQCAQHLAKEMKGQHEIQAIIYEDLADYVKKNDFMLYLLNKTGEILSKIKL